MEPTERTDLPSDRPALPAGVRHALTVVLVLLGMALLGGVVWFARAEGAHLKYFFHAYLTGYCFYLSISLGALFFVALHHVTRAGWSVTVRRLAELLAANMFCLILLFLPIVIPLLLGNTNLYPWSDHETVAHSELLQQKTVYLNPIFFAVRGFTYLILWSLLTAYYLKLSVAQDHSGQVAYTRRMERISPAALLLFALTVTFASFDWLMSLTPTWYSTIFGVYFFGGAVVAGLAAMILLAMLLQAAGRLDGSVTIEHYHTLGKFLFGFVFFWGYIAFSQYLLMWYANIPEETEWYLVRQTGPWLWVTLALLFGSLLIPFMGLLPRWAKRRKAILAFWALWLLAFHWLDLYWLVMPGAATDGLPLGPIDVVCLLGLGCLYLAGLIQTAGNRSLVPLADPRLDESLAYENDF